MRPVMILSLPNSGTEWLMSVYAKYSLCKKPQSEYFNPICNKRPGRKYELDDAFGSEQRGMYIIATPWENLPTKEVYEKTWCKDDSDLTKEVWSQFKVGFFVQHFDCFVLLRNLELSLPPARSIAKQFGPAMMASLIFNRGTLEPLVGQMVDVAMEFIGNENLCSVAGYYVMSWKLLAEAEKHGIPVVKYDLLMSSNKEELVEILSVLPSVKDVEGMAGEIVRTRSISTKDFDELGAECVLRKLIDIGGERYSRLIVPSMFKDIVLNPVFKKVKYPDMGYTL